MWGFLIALLSGALMSIQGVLNTEATKQTGIWVAAGWVQLTAFLTCILLWFIADKSPVGAIFQVRPWYMLLGGLIGAFITFTVIKSMDGLGPAKATLLIVVTQIIVAYAIEKADWRSNRHCRNCHIPLGFLIHTVPHKFR